MNDLIPNATIEETNMASWRAADAFATAVNKAEHYGHLEITDYASYVINKLTIESQVHLLFQIIGNGIDLEKDQPNRHGKELAMSIAEIMGPDYMQGFYRMVVLATKLA